jgi:hypothetical protein
MGAWDLLHRGVLVGLGGLTCLALYQTGKAGSRPSLLPPKHRLDCRLAALQ